MPPTSKPIPTSSEIWCPATADPARRRGADLACSEATVAGALTCPLTGAGLTTLTSAPANLARHVLASWHLPLLQPATTLSSRAGAQQVSHRNKRRFAGGWAETGLRECAAAAGEDPYDVPGVPDGRAPHTGVAANHGRDSATSSTRHATTTRNRDLSTR